MNNSRLIYSCLWVADNSNVNGLALRHPSGDSMETKSTQTSSEGEYYTHCKDGLCVNFPRLMLSINHDVESGNFLIPLYKLMCGIQELLQNVYTITVSIFTV